MRKVTRAPETVGAGDVQARDPRLMTRGKWVVAAICVLGLAGPPARAENLGDTGWHFKLAPYGWLVGVQGDLAFGTHPESEIDLPFSNILNHLKMFFMAQGEASKGRLTLFGDGVYAKLSDSSAISTTFGPFAAGPRTVGPFSVGPGGRHTIGPFVFEKQIGPFSETIDYGLTMRLTIVEGGAMYRLREGTLDGGAGGEALRYSLSLRGGARYTELDMHIVTGAGADVSLSEDWVDPFVGARGTVDLSSKWRLGANFDVGGFGVGSDFTWKADVGFTYRSREKQRLILGYRVLSQDYKTGSGSNFFEWDVTLHGPVIALELVF
jgi:hypothetical protein